MDLEAGVYDYVDHGNYTRTCPHHPLLSLRQIVILLHELEAAKTTRAKYMDTNVMDCVAQRFRTEVPCMRSSFW